jgi:hypothetical protein
MLCLRFLQYLFRYYKYRPYPFSLPFRKQTLTFSAFILPQTSILLSAIFFHSAWQHYAGHCIVCFYILSRSCYPILIIIDTFWFIFHAPFYMTAGELTRRQLASKQSLSKQGFTSRYSLTSPKTFHYGKITAMYYRRDGYRS